MTKKEIHQGFIDQLEKELSAITASAKRSFATATDEEHHAEGKYDTFSLESSYLARGQAKRVKELTDALDRLQVLPLKDLDATMPIHLSALVRLKASNGEERTLFVGPAAGGETITVDGNAIMMITTSSPMGRAVLGKTVGDTFDMRLGIDVQTFTVLSVE
ncbi:MAG: GreA/GreB family elongation factor [Kiritimatiellae bacterium]|nr:GreA/GreB family elongation factor [Kiritimatiellia bacterium]